MRDRVRLYLNVPDGKTLVTLYDIDSWIKGNAYLELLLFLFECFVFLCKTVPFADCSPVSVDDGIPHPIQTIPVVLGTGVALSCRVPGARERGYYDALLHARNR
jgi:hypothetical protein